MIFFLAGVSANSHIDLFTRLFLIFLSVLQFAHWLQPPLWRDQF